MDKQYHKSIRPILDLYDELRIILKDIQQIDLPKIVILGDQSSGKSSVLESITGINLPRGENTVTKCPIEIKLRCCKENEDESASIKIEDEPEYKDGIKLEDLAEVIKEKQEIIISKHKKEIVNCPISVKINKINAPDLTLYDLPGMTYKNNIADEIRSIYRHFTKDEEALVLLVLNASTDLTNSEAIEIVKQNKNYKQRTIPIITKIDQALNNNDKKIGNKILNNDLDLSYYPVIVRNRTNEELINNLSIEEVRKKEMDLFTMNGDIFKEIPEDCLGTENLIKKLVDIQRQRLNDSKISLKEKIHEILKAKKEEQKNLPPSLETLTEKTQVFKSLLKNAITNYTKIVEGENHYKKSNPNSVEKSFANRIKDLFYAFQNKFEMHGYKFLKSDFRKVITERVREFKGFVLPNSLCDLEVIEFITNDLKILKAEYESVLRKVVDLVEEILF